MATGTRDRADRNGNGVLDALPIERLTDQARELVAALGERALEATAHKVEDTTDRLVDYVAHGGSHGDGGRKSPMRAVLGAGAVGLKGLVTNALSGGSGGGGKGGGGKKIKLTNIEEGIEVGVPVRVAYNQWTQFQDFPKFMKRVETVEQQADEKLSWKAGIFLSHRTWESTIREQVPDELIVWQSKGQKGHVDGTVTFHEVAPNLTKILMVLAYHPQGLFERTGNLWRAQGRRARLELKHFRRHVMTQTILDPDAVEGWRGVIHDGEVVKSHEDALEEEQSEEDQETDGPEDSSQDESDEFEDDFDEDEENDEEEPYEDEDEPYDEDEYEDDEAEYEDASR